MFRLALTTLLTIGSALAVPVPITLNLDTGGTTNALTIDIEVRRGLLSSSDTETTTLSGSVSGTVDFDPETQTISSLSLSSGDVAATDMNFSFRFGSGFFSVTQNANTSNVRGEPITSTAPVSNGSFDATAYSILLNEGQLDSSGIAGAFTINLAEEPLIVPGSGTGTATVTPLAAADTYQLTISLPINGSQELDNENIEGTVTYDGTLAATATFTAQADTFATWAAAGGFSADFDGNANGDQLDNGLAWALGFAPGAFVSPLSLDQVTLGATATRAAITVECSNDITDPESWSPLPAQNLSTSANPIPAGTTGNITITRDENKRFYRLVASEE